MGGSILFGTEFDPFGLCEGGLLQTRVCCCCASASLTPPFLSLPPTGFYTFVLVVCFYCSFDLWRMKSLRRWFTHNSKLQRISMSGTFPLHYSDVNFIAYVTFSPHFHYISSHSGVISLFRLCLAVHCPHSKFCEGVVGGSAGAHPPLPHSRGAVCRGYGFQDLLGLCLGQISMVCFK